MPASGVRGKGAEGTPRHSLMSQKEAAGRPKDLLMATEYRVLSDELRAP